MMRVVAILLVMCGVASAAAESLVVLPSAVKLDGPEARQTLLAQRSVAGTLVGQVADVRWTSSDEKVVRIVKDQAVPVADGKATLTAKAGSHSANVSVVVTNAAKPFDPSFRNDVQPVLTRTGCNMGACHGALAGKNGFRLSLRAYDDDGDYTSLTRHALGRRIVPEDPARSLLLLKPTGAVPHKGGERVAVDSPEYRVLVEWIANGAKPPKSEDARVERIEVLPANVTLRAGATQQLVVMAHFSDGSVRDATRLAKFTAADGTVATVTESGLVKIMGNGESPVTAWFMSKLALATVTVPWEQTVPADVFASASKANFIDELVLEKLRELNVPPSPRASDGEFIRRAFLDTIGVLPTAEETRRFLADGSPDKRDRLIEHLLSRPEFVDYWAYKWSDLLLVSSRKLRPPAMWAYYGWVRDQVAANAPWDQFARDVVTAKGSTLENGAANFYILHDDPAVMAETASVAFLGMAINCAKCHNHPLEKWTNGQYYGFANLFARVRAKNGSGEGNFSIYAATEGDLVQPLTGRPQAPTPLDGKPMAIDDPGDRRVALAAWLTSRENPYFARAITNRVWANFMGKGLVEPIDDLRLTNPASNERLLNALASHLADSKFDLKALMRVILRSEAYQRSSTPLPANAKDSRLYARYYPKRLQAEVMLDAFSQVTGAPTSFAGYPAGWRAMQLPDANLEHYFLKSFGRAERANTCECEKTVDPSMAQVLHIANGDTINKKCAAANNAIDKLLAAKSSDEQIVEELYLAALCRPPTAKERATVLAIWSESAKDVPKRQLVEDAFWGVLSSNEFLFNH